MYVPLNRFGDRNGACPTSPGAKAGFFAGLVDSVVDNFGGFYPELIAKRDTVSCLTPFTLNLPAQHSGLANDRLQGNFSARRRLELGFLTAADGTCQIHEVIEEEEKSFGRTLAKGAERFDKAAEAAKSQGASQVALSVPLPCHSNTT